MRHNRYISWVAAFAGILAIGPAWAQSTQDLPVKPIGKVMVASGTATIERVNAHVVFASVEKGGQVKKGDHVYLGDVVTTGDNSQLGINFIDGASFVMSSNARMTLDQYVYDPNDQKNNSMLFSLAKGAFTFLAGSIAKTGNMKVDTPVATMGIRGTTPRVEIGDDGTVKFSTLLERPPVPRLPPINQPDSICKGC
jgi:hypothetical protein